MGQVKVRVEGSPEDITQIIHNLQAAYVMVSQGEPQKLTGAGDRAVVYQYIVVNVGPFAENPGHYRR